MTIHVGNIRKAAISNSKDAVFSNLLWDSTRNSIVESVVAFKYCISSGRAGLVLPSDLGQNMWDLIAITPMKRHSPDVSISNIG